MKVERTSRELARIALPQIGERFAELITSVPDVEAKATADWTIAETAAHVGFIGRVYTAIIRGDGSPLPLPLLDEPMATARLDTVSRMNAIALVAYPERDPARLAAQLQADIDTVLSLSADYDPDRPTEWLGGSLVPVAGVLSHLVNEMLIHGLDIARAAGRSWVIPPSYEALFFELFLVGMIRNSTGLLMADARPSPRRIAVEFRSSYTTPVVLELQHGQPRAVSPGVPVDVRIRFDPGVLMPMMFGRISKVRAALSGGVRISGRRPWLLPEFLRTVRMP